MGQPSDQNNAHKASQMPGVASPRVYHTDMADRRQLISPGNHIRADATVPHRTSPIQQTELSDLPAYLACRDLLTDGFKVFNNRPESYLSWKSMYCSTRTPPQSQ